jgi:hypothetical protein
VLDSLIDAVESGTQRVMNGGGLSGSEAAKAGLAAGRGAHLNLEITKGSINESLAYPQDFFRPVIGQSAYAFVLAHNHPSGYPLPSEADIRLTRRLDEGARMLQINMLDHVIVGQSFSHSPTGQEALFARASGFVQAFLAEIRSVARNRPQQLSFRFLVLS